MSDLITITRAQYDADIADAWDEGYKAGNLDGYFQTHEEKNPYRADEIEAGQS